MATEQRLDFIGISLDPKRAEGLDVVANLTTTRTGAGAIGRGQPQGMRAGTALRGSRAE